MQQRHQLRWASGGGVALCWLAALAALSGLSFACSRETHRPPPPAEPLAQPSALAPPAAASAPSPPGPLVVLAGGDIELARSMGKRLLREPAYDPFHAIAPLLASADVRFANLESQLSEQGGETMSSHNPLVFTGPPCGADVLARAGFTVVSTANNHAWDYGRRAFFETISNLDRVGVRHAGTGATLDEAYAPAIVKVRGQRLAFFALTAIWNQGPLERHEARDLVAGRDLARLRAQIERVKGEVRAVLVSVHAGDEYKGELLPWVRELHVGAIEAGADVVLGHHPHVMQGVSWHRGRPMVHGLGNLAMQMHSDHAWTGTSFVARLTFVEAEVGLEACPVRIVGQEPHPLVDEAHTAMFRARLEALSRPLGGVQVGPIEGGCARVSPTSPK